jgi:small subunit ribosomal protein S20
LATHKSAIKRHQQSLKKRQRNRTIKSTMKTSVRTLLEAIESKQKDTVQKNLSRAASVIAKTASKGVIHKNTAARKIARLSRRAKAVIQSQA